MHDYVPGYLATESRRDLIDYLGSLKPLWEHRYSARRPPPNGQPQRILLRPVYWLGNWQFACLDYYRPPKGVRDRCVAAEPFPPVIERIRLDIESRIRARCPQGDVPRGWRLNTCLVNFYGHRFEAGKWCDTARVGEHRDFEPGPVASLSLGARALFQFVPSRRVGQRDAPILSQWLDDGSLQIFAGKRFKDELLHRVQRVARSDVLLPPVIDGFRTRRINLTFRFVPSEHVQPFSALSRRARADVREYVERLAERSSFFRDALRAESSERA